MTRDIKKAINDYSNRAKNGRYAFYTSDFEQIMDLAVANTPNPNNVLYHAIDYALMAGFEIGYRTAKREASNR